MQANIRDRPPAIGQIRIDLWHPTFVVKRGDMSWLQGIYHIFRPEEMREFDSHNQKRTIFRVGFLCLAVLLLTACQTGQPSDSSPSSTAEPIGPAVPMPTAVDEPSPTSSSAPTASPTQGITPTPTVVPISLGADQAVPAELKAAAQQLAITEPNRFAWADLAGDVRVSVGAEPILATWVYAVAAPFATIEDQITLDVLQSRWRDGSLLLDEATARLLQSLWGDADQPAAIVPEADLVQALWQQQAEAGLTPLTILPFEKLIPSLKVLRLDGMAPIDVDFRPDGYALSVPVGLSGAPELTTQVQVAWAGPASNWDDSRISRVAMTGPAGMRRAVADRMEKYGIQYPAEETGPVLQAVDIAHMSNENAFAPDCPMPDPFDSVNVCNRDEYLALMTWMGIDINEMTGNHLNDWGVQSLQHTFDLYEAAGIQTFGGGRNLAEARQPLLIEHNGNRLAFVGCNPVGPESAWAREDYPGSLPCEDYQFIKQEIGRLADQGFLVMATLQYLEDYQYEVLDEQRVVFQGLAEAGATAVSGSHAHHPQGFSFHDGSFIHYGLGNLLADQMWTLGTRQTFIDIYVFFDGRLLSVDLWTGLNEDYARIRTMTPEERRQLLDAVFAASDW